MENAPTNPPISKKPFLNAKVAGLGFVIFVVLQYITLKVLLYVMMSSFISATLSIVHIVPIVIAIIVGFFVGFKDKERAFLNSLAIAILITLFSQITLVGKKFMGIESLLQYAIVIGLPVIIAGVIGGFVTKNMKKNSKILLVLVGMLLLLHIISFSVQSGIGILFLYLAVLPLLILNYYYIPLVLLIGSITFSIIGHKTNKRYLTIIGYLIFFIPWYIILILAIIVGPPTLS